MSEQPYDIGHDLGDDVQLSSCAMYQDRFPQRHRIDEIDDEAGRSISQWVREEDGRESDAVADPLEESTSYCFEDA
ncbi:hypothetical protein ABZ297_42500 [Nonomuraea sp. NPDC005983]|uniref:hypothetical protein n=1 Tax=Nonomuraea sp. NPDC005983 TaxID=3155595 RepID=UPI0033AC4BE0